MGRRPGLVPASRQPRPQPGRDGSRLGGVGAGDPDRRDPGRADATRITVTPEQLGDPAAMQRYAEAQSRLSAAIIPLQRLQEAYPELRSQQNFATLMQQLEAPRTASTSPSATITRRCAPIIPRSAPSPR